MCRLQILLFTLGIEKAGHDGDVTVGRYQLSTSRSELCSSYLRSLGMVQNSAFFIFDSSIERTIFF